MHRKPFRLTELPACVLERLLCPGYSAKATGTPCTLPATYMLGAQASLPRLVEHPASSLPVCLLDRLHCPGYCTACHLPACLFAGQASSAQATAHPAVSLPGVCWPGYSAQATEGTAASCLPVCLPGQATLAQATANPATCLFACLLARLFCPGDSPQAIAHPATCLPSCLLAAQVALPSLLNTLPLWSLPGLPG